MHSSVFNATSLALAPLLIIMCMCIPDLKACSLIGKGLLYEKLPQSQLRYGALAAYGEVERKPLSADFDACLGHAIVGHILDFNSHPVVGLLLRHSVALC